LEDARSLAVARDGEYPEKALRDDAAAKIRELKR
jgi:hypothetical protein